MPSLVGSEMCIRDRHTTAAVLKKLTAASFTGQTHFLVLRSTSIRYLVQGIYTVSLVQGRDSNSISSSNTSDT